MFDYHSADSVPTVKHRGVSVIIWGNMNTEGVGTIKVCGYITILADKITPSVQRLGRGGIFQHDNNPKLLPELQKNF